MSILNTSTFPGTLLAKCMKLPLAIADPVWPADCVAFIANNAFVFQFGRVNHTSNGATSTEKGTVDNIGQYFTDGIRTSVCSMGPVSQRGAVM